MDLRVSNQQAPNMKIISIISVGLSISLACSGQSAFIEKITKYKKAHLAIGIKTGDSSKLYFVDCFFKPVTLLDDTTKIRLIEELLYFVSDTTICDHMIYDLSGSYTVIRKTSLSKEYNLQIDALILINYIALSSNAFYYSPYPLLYDSKSGKEICCGGSELDRVIEIYKKWFKKLKKGGFNNYCYPLVQKEYEWFGGMVKQQKIKEYPQWDNYFNCKELN